MSSFTVRDPNGLFVTYGFDHALGHFITVMNKENKHILIDKASIFHGRSTIMALFDEYRHIIPHTALRQIALDLPIQELTC